jgi:hypothetical protein
MEKEDVVLVTHDTILNFPKKVEKPFVEFLSKERFSHYLDLLEVKKHLDFTPCFVASMKGGDVVFICLEIINDLTKNLSSQKKILFVEAIILHELFHIWNNIQVKKKNDLYLSEALVHEELELMYPEHAKLLGKFTKHRKKH